VTSATESAASNNPAKLFGAFASDVTSFQNETIQGQYQITPRVSLSGTRNQNAGFGLQTRIKKTW